MRKAKLFALTVLAAAFAFTSCSGAITAYKNAFYTGEKLPGEALAAGDVLFYDSSATSYETFINTNSYTSSGIIPKAIVLSVEGDTALCAVVQPGSSPGFGYPSLFSENNYPIEFTASQDSKERVACNPRLPTMEELKLVYQNKDMVNALLSCLKNANFSNIESLEGLESGVYFSSEKTGETATYNSATVDVYKTFNFKDGTEGTFLDGYNLEAGADYSSLNILSVIDYSIPQGN